MTTNGKVTSDRTRLVESHFGKEGFQDVSRYQRSGYDFLLRLRIIDEQFVACRARRHRRVFGELEEELRSDITMLVLLAPGERAQSLANLKFESPSPSLLKQPVNASV